MEAFIVPQIQPQATPAPNANSINQVSDESSFAPTLNNAISAQNSKNIKNPNQKNPADSNNHSVNRRNTDTDGVATESGMSIGTNDDNLELTYALHSEFIIDHMDEKGLQLGIEISSAPVENNLSLSKHISGNVEELIDTTPEVKNLTSQLGQHLEGFANVNVTKTDIDVQKTQVFAPLERLNISETKGGKNDLQSPTYIDTQSPTYASQSITILPENTSTPKRLSSLINGNSHRAELVEQNPKSANDGIKATISLSTQPKYTISNSHKLSFLQNEDSLTFSQIREGRPHVIMQRVGSPIAEPVMGDTLSATPTLSTEKILSEITQIPTNNQNTSLRNENPKLRQDIAGQFIDKSISRQSVISDQLSGQQQFEPDNEQQNQNQFNTSAKTGDIAGQNTISQLPGAQTVDKTIFSVAEHLKPGLPIFNQHFSEDNVLNQVMQRLRLSQNLLDSKLVMKLHPAELGELKINVQLREGSINASILAQNQQVQEILEKNLPRLKEMMEQQGLTVDEIVINLDSDLESQYNLFEDHLANDENSSSPRKTKNSQENFTVDNDSEEFVEVENNESDLVVNVKV